MEIRWPKVKMPATYPYSVLRNIFEHQVHRISKSVCSVSNRRFTKIGYLKCNLIQCFVSGLQALFTFKPVPPKMEARTHLQIGQVLMGYTKNIDLARSHLEQAVGLNICVR